MHASIHAILSLSQLEDDWLKPGRAQDVVGQRRRESAARDLAVLHERRVGGAE